MKPKETLTLTRPGQNSVWRTAECVVWSRPARMSFIRGLIPGKLDAVVLNVEASGKAVAGDEEYTPEPSAIVSWFMPSFTPEQLVGKTFEIPRAYDWRAKDHLVTLYYYEHMDVNENRVEFLSRDGDLFHVRWTGTMKDNSPPEGSPANPTIKVVADFSAKLVER